MNGPVNRSLGDPALDDVDHALGRPRNPLGETCRNYYAADPDTVGFDGSPWWERRGNIPGGLVVWRVTAAGRQALADHLRALRDTRKETAA